MDSSVFSKNVLWLDVCSSGSLEICALWLRESRSQLSDVMLLFEGLRVPVPEKKTKRIVANAFSKLLYVGCVNRITPQ